MHSIFIQELSVRDSKLKINKFKLNINQKEKKDENKLNLYCESLAFFQRDTQKYCYYLVFKYICIISMQ